MWPRHILVAMSLASRALRYMWLLTAPVTAFRGWQVSSATVSPVLERMGVVLMVSIVPVAIVATLVDARRRGTLGDRFIMPWWCAVAIMLLGFPVLFGLMSFAYDRMHGHRVLASVVLTLMWLAPNTVALLGLAISGWRDATLAELVTADDEDVAAEKVVAIPYLPADMPQYRPGTAPGHLLTDWQLGQQGLRPGGAPRAWLLLDRGPGMYLYDVDEAKER